MGTNLNFKSYGNDPPGDGGGGRVPANALPLARQTSIYSLTFDELQNTMGGAGKDFGSMNMDELLKNIWTAEEIQGMASSSAAQDGGGGGVGVPGQGPGGYLQRQGSLTLPRTLSTKTVDEVWKDMAKEYGVGKDGGGGGGGGGSNRPRREPTLGEVTLEEFLVRAGVVREDVQLGGGAGFFGELSRPNNANDLQIGFQQTGRNLGLMGNLNSDGTNQISLQATNLPLNVNGVRCNQQQQSQQVQALTQMQQHQKQLFPKQPAVNYASQLGSPASSICWSSSSSSVSCKASSSLNSMNSSSSSNSSSNSSSSSDSSDSSDSRVRMGPKSTHKPPFIRRGISVVPSS